MGWCNSPNVKLKTTYYFVLLTLALAACRQDAPPEAPAEAQAVLHEPEAIHSFNGDFKNLVFQGRIPDEISYVSKVQQQRDQVTGAVRLTIGKEYALLIKEYHVSIEELRSDLSAESLFEHVFFDEGDDSFFYEVVMPDGHSAGHHYVKLIDFGTHRLLVRTDEHVDYGYFTAHLAAKTINSMQFSQKTDAK